ncbi:succinate dehydrogenase assembly factor 2 [Pseudothioclava arenosa]|uniref:FAD assembly factor SdhE n=1 Tax=Pseudothioclava arenosa TaxID=1795308 RepID=A0A2A4CNB7_9RHOB|nr:succinate dehydrogenase assembly factor 2 [Pseudothioclava arenosa]PCD75594.1 succinate dehydrogenase assembly factor 2 [Pseudothioclava arenosa]
MTETPEARLKRMRMRSWRRGTKEMDLILGPYADEKLATMDAAELDLFDLLLEEYDQDLYPWVSGTRPCPPEYLDLLTRISAFAKTRHGTD